MAAVPALLRHGATNPDPFSFRGSYLVDPRLGGNAACGQTLDRLSGFAGRGFIANIDVAIAHEQNPLQMLRHNAQLNGKVAAYGSNVSLKPLLRFTAVPRAFSTRERLRSREHAMAA